MRRVVIALALFLVAVGNLPPLAAQGAWTTVFDGKNGLKGWTPVGDANWEVVDGVVQATKGSAASYLVSQNSYTDFEISAEFWVSPDANSGIFIRCTDPKMITAMNAYEVNIFDMRPDPTYRTGAIVNVAKPLSVVNTGNKWNTFDITAKGPKMTVVLNGMKIAEGENSMNPRGPFALQWGAGTVKFRNVRVRPL